MTNKPLRPTVTPIVRLWHGYATFGVKYAHEPHPTLPAHVAHPEKVVEIWAPTREMARSLITGLTMVYNHEHHVAYFSDLYDWPTDLEKAGKFTEYYPGGVSMIIDCRET